MSRTPPRFPAPSFRSLVFAGCSLAWPFSALAQIAVQLPAEVVTASRTAQPLGHVAATLKSLDETTLRHTPAATLDGALRSVPGFSLFRRSDSFTANPTAQGVSLRGLGPSGASRSLVLLDGVPLNDPFGGWVAWTKVPRESLSRVELLPGGGATAWGNAALGGVVQLLSAIPQRTRSSLVGVMGDYGTRSAEGFVAQELGHDALTLRGRIFATDGFSLVAPERRGPIDVPAWSRHRWISGGWRHTFGPKLQLGAVVRGFEEKRGNGTPYQRNSSQEKFLALYAAGETGSAFTWQATGYAQDQAFASTFSAVNAARSAETPASDQFDVPSTAFGAAWTGHWRHLRGSGESRTNAGVDARFVRGETRENFTFANGDFTRQRVAGGRQNVAGLFVFHERRVVADLRASVGARFDAWNETDGHRRETDRLSGVVLRNDRYVDRDGTAIGPSAGVVWQRGDSNSPRLRAHVQRAYRRPTLNELYRPFRVGANVTEANAALDTERATSAEIGGEWNFFLVGPKPLPAGMTVYPHPQHRPRLTLGVVGFWNELEDVVGNVTLVRGPGTFPIVGLVAAGGVGRQRLNLDRARVQGIELSARWRPTEATTVTAEFLYDDATIRRASVAPALVGKRIAQVPRHSASVTGSIAAGFGFTLNPRVRWLGRQFEDDENQLILGEVVIADLGLSRPFGKYLEVFLNAENIGNARIETGRSADGLVNVGTPRLALFGVRGSW